MKIRKVSDVQSLEKNRLDESLVSKGMLRIRSESDVVTWERRVQSHAVELIRAIRSDQRNELSLFADLRFATYGWHPVTGEPLNPIEQINESWTFLVALEATRWLLQKHPESGGFLIAPGAHMAQPLDVMSVNPGIVGAETFAAVKVSNNRKLKRDIEKLQSRAERHRYVLFSAPHYNYPEPTRLPKLERCTSIQVWAVNVQLITHTQS